MKKGIGIVFLLLCLTGCSVREVKQEKQIFAFDTIMSFTAYGERAAEGIQKVADQMNVLERRWSVTDKESEIAKLNQGQSVLLSEDTRKILQKARTISEQTGGAVDISIYPLVQAWGFTTGEYTVPSAEQITTLLPRVGYQKIPVPSEEMRLPVGMQLDLGAIAKGYASEQSIRILQDSGVENAIVSLGGNVQTLGARPDGEPWKIAIQSPDGQDSAGTLQIQGEAAVITSGDYQRYFERDGVRYHHILNPKTGYPANSTLASVTIIAQDAVRADGLSTALFVMGLEAGMNFWKEHQDFDAVWMTRAGELWRTPGLEGKFIPAGQWNVSVVEG